MAWGNKIYQGVLLGLGASQHASCCHRPCIDTHALHPGALWALRCCVPFIASTVSERRRALAVRCGIAAADLKALLTTHPLVHIRLLAVGQVYPTLLLYTALAWLALLN